MKFVKNLLGMMQDKVGYRTEWTIRRFADRESWLKGEPYSVSRVPSKSSEKGNMLLNEGINNLWTVVCSAGGVKWDSANARLGVGDSDIAEAATQTGLQAAVNKTFKAMDAGYPTFGTNQKAVWRATFMETEANHGWQEFTVVNAADDSGQNLNRKVSNQGTKILGQIWELTLEIILS